MSTGTTLGNVGRSMLTHAPIPSTVVAQLRTEFGAILCENDTLDSATRIDWLASDRNLPASTANALCDHAFSVDEIAAVLDAVKHKSPAKVLLRVHRDDRDAVSAILAHPRGVHIAADLVGSPSYPQLALLAHIDAMPAAKVAKLITHLTPDELADDAAVAFLLGLEEQVSENRRGSLVGAFTALVHARPGLTPLLLDAGAPETALTAIAGSPWITDEVVGRLGTAALGPYAQMALAGNPWTRLDGPVRDVVTDKVAVDILDGRPRRRVPEMSAGPLDIVDEELEAALYRSMPSEMKQKGRPDLCAVLVQNPHFTPAGARRALELLIDFDNGWYSPPRWVLDRSYAVFAANYPELADQVPDQTPWNPTTPSSPQEADPERAEHLFNNVEARRIGMSLHTAAPALALFAEKIGDDADAWVAALLLVDGVDCSLSELADIAVAAA